MTKTDAEKPKAMAGGSKYVVLQLRTLNPKPDEKQDSWVQVAVVEARDRAHAIRVHTGDGADVIEGTFKAVPVASWKGSVVTTRVTAASRKLID